MKYTQWGPTVDKVVNRHVAMLKELIIKKIGKRNIYSILLIGGFARGEGSMKIEKRGKITPLNDYDLYVITHQKIDRKIFEKISLDFNKMAKIDSQFSFDKSSHVMNFYSDIRSMTTQELKNVSPFIKYYEIKNTGRIIYGKNALGLIPDYQIEDIPLQDGLRILFNRASLLIECFRSKYLDGKISQKEKETIIFYVSKSYLSCAESLLLLSRKFVPSYAQRATILKKTYKQDFPKLYEKLPDLPRNVSEFTDFKLKTNFNWFQDDQAVNLWLKVAKDLFQVIHYYLQKTCKIRVSKVPISFSSRFYQKAPFVFISPYLSFILKKKTGLELKESAFTLKGISFLAQYYLNFAYFKALKKATRKNYLPIFFQHLDPWIKIFRAAPLLLLAVSEDKEINVNFLRRGINYLRYLYPFPKFSKNKKKMLDEAFQYYADAFRIIQFIQV